MIPKVIRNHHTDKSSFKKLTNYITKGITQSEAFSEQYGWGALTRYITQENILDGLGGSIEKAIAVEIGQLSSLANAPAEMYAVARQAPRAKDPVYHYVLSWPEHERPKVEDVFSAVRDTLTALGIADHQYVIAIHADTDNLHAHVEVNRVHPQTFQVFDTYRDYLTLHYAAREAEIKYGWQHDNGFFQVIEVNGKKCIVRNNEYVDPDLVPTRPGAKRAEVWSGEQSLETWCKAEPARDLKRVLEDKKTSSWQNIHRALAQYGLELRDAGGGGFKVVDISAGTPEKMNKPLTVSAAAAFRFMKRAELEKRFGAFEARSPDLQLDEPKRTYKRDPHKRLEARLARKALREDLYHRFKAEEREARERQTLAKKALVPFAQEDKNRYQKLQAAYRARRIGIRQDAKLTPVQKQQAYMLAKVTMLKAREQLVQQIQQERAIRRSLLPKIPRWREWVEQQAQRGDEAAISALRGMIYQESRNKKKKLARGNAQIEENAILPAVHQCADPQVRGFENLLWNVGKNGCVTYRFNNGEMAFCDEGERLTFGRKEVSDDALALTVRYGADKWKEGIRIGGGDFAFKKRVVRMAIEQNIVVQNIELREVEKQIRGELAAMRGTQRKNTRPKPVSKGRERESCSR
ncbi:putative relaxase/mobilization nuclease family protein MobA [Candidatus Glomeribacter gigasporarum BEG34]|uniref:Putative relaxase/mobilization nuclease family protein MobA n=1 Tax=Candidatus Glomeribacter gigasporarum BEG34 TaxID=1070319 RepID=G2J9B2_9BURK|nr:TraI/MobA(P) family conjugative relaxase [Candidatus Glomeribacter gigasporarum]CCD29359.1 putative relaxase/mobilization nuclease family protein MobA [Candidatus Glomeribacter gigasporarum BEG34]